MESDECNIKDYVTDIQYGYDTDLNIYLADTSNGLNKVNPSTMMEDIMVREECETLSGITFR